MAALENKPRFGLPENWTVEGVVCVVFTIPADQEYFGMIIGLVDALKWSKSFARDPTETGAAIVSRTWQAALESEPARLLECGEVDMAKIRYRPKPGAPWVQQWKYDDEDTWYDGLIQPHWPTNIEPDIEAWENAQDEGGAIFRGWHEWIVGQFITGTGLGLTKSQILDGIMGQVGQYAHNPTATRNAIGQAYDEYVGLPDASGYITDCPYLDAWQELFDLIHENGPGWLDRLADWMSGALTDASDALTQALNNAAGTMLGEKLSQFAHNQAGGGGGSGFGGECEWTHVVDLTDTLEPFQIVGYTNAPCIDVMALWSDGVGIEAQTSVPCGIYVFNFEVELPYPFKMDLIKFGAESGTAGSSRNVVIRLNEDAACDSDTAGFPTHATDSFQTDPALSEDCTEAVEKIRVIGYSEFSQPVITRFEVRGFGANPFKSIE